MLPAFHRERIAESVETIFEETERAIEQLVPGTTTDLYDWTRHLAMRVAMRALFGLDPDGPQARAIRHRACFEEALAYYASDYLLRVFRGKRSPSGALQAAARKLDVLIYGEIAERRASGRRGTDILGLERQRRAQRNLVASALRRDHDESPRLVQFAERKAVDERVRVGCGGEIAGGSRERDVIAQLPRLGGERHRDRARAKDDQRRVRQHRLDEDIHGALARAHVAGEADAVAVLAGLDAEFGQHVFRLHRHHARFAVGERLARRLQHRAPGAAAADPARHDGAVGTDDRLGAGLGRGHRHGTHHGGEDERLLRGLHLRDEIH